MRTSLNIAASIMLAISMLVAPNMAAQSRSSSSSSRSSSSSSATRSSGSSSSSSQSRSSSSGSQVRSSSSSSGSASQSRSSGSSASQSRSSVSSSGSATRSSGSSSSASQSASQSRSSSSGSQVRSSSSSSSGSASQSRSSGSSQQSRSSVSSSGDITRSSGSSSSSSQSRSSAASAQQQTRSSVNGNVVTGSDQSRSSGAAVRSSNVSRDGLGVRQIEADQVITPPAPYYRDNAYNYRYQDDYRIDDRHEMHRVPPRMRDVMPWDRPGHFWYDAPHYYGYRIHSLPPHYRHISHWGRDYYYYNGIYYRPFGSTYVVCRPPYGTPLEIALDRAILNVIRFAYFCDTYRNFEVTFDYYNAIARQNLLIAQQNARIIARNRDYALNGRRALSAYELASKLGLVQSYAYANSEYYYQDGVFYTISASGLYTTIVPPAGALVTSLPDDYETIVMNGMEFYMVDNTVYRTTLFDGHPYLEVLGQMYGNLYNNYDLYR